MLEALGRRRDSRALPGLFSALTFDDEPSVINAVDSIAQIGSALDDEQRRTLLNALKGSDNQKRSVIQAHTRLGIEKADHEISVLEDDANPLVAGAARAYAAKIHGRIDRLKPLIPQLTDPIAGRRRSAVIDLGDAGESSVLEHLVSSPVSMPLRAKSAFQIVDPEKTGLIPAPYAELITRLLQDNPVDMALQQDWICESSLSDIEKISSTVTKASSTEAH